MTQAGDELEPEVLSYSTFLNRQLLEAWRERLRVYEGSADNNQMIGHSLRLSRLWVPRRFLRAGHRPELRVNRRGGSSD